MGRRVGIALWGVVSFATSAFADEPPPPVDSPIAPDPLPPPVPPAPDGAGPSPNAAAPTQTNAAVHAVQQGGFTVDRHGIMLLGGFRFADGDRSQFLVVYVPLPLAAAPRLKLGLTGSVEYHRDVLPGDDFVAWSYYVQPMAQYDWRLPITSSKGDFAIAAEGGIGVGQLRIRWPSDFSANGMTYWEHLTAVTIHLAAAFQFHAHNGLVLSIQPLGLTKLINDPEPPSPMWTVNNETVFEFALAGGYRWR